MGNPALSDLDLGLEGRVRDTALRLPSSCLVDELEINIHIRGPLFCPPGAQGPPWHRDTSLGPVDSAPGLASSAMWPPVPGSALADPGIRRTADHSRPSRRCRTCHQQRRKRTRLLTWCSLLTVPAHPRQGLACGRPIIRVGGSRTHRGMSNVGNGAVTARHTRAQRRRLHNRIRWRLP